MGGRASGNCLICLWKYSWRFTLNENIQFLREGEKGTQWNHVLSTCYLLGTHIGRCIRLPHSFSSLPIRCMLLFSFYIWVNWSSKRWRDFPNSTRLVRRAEPELKVLCQHIHLCTYCDEDKLIGISLNRKLLSEISCELILLLNSLFYIYLYKWIF